MIFWNIDMMKNEQHTTNSLKNLKLKLSDYLKYNLKENEMPTVKTFIRNARLLMCIFLTASCSAGNISIGQAVTAQAKTLSLGLSAAR